MSKYKMKPADQRVVIKPFEKKERRTQSGIILTPEVQKEVPEMGTIVEIGHGTKDYPMNYKLGQTVIYSEYAGLNLKLNLEPHGEHIFKVMNQMDIMGVLEEVD